MPSRVKHTLMLAIFLSAILFLFYRGVINLDNHEHLHDTLRTLENLQVQLHRDVLRYRNGEIRQYDTLNNTLDAIHQNIIMLGEEENDIPQITIGKDIESLIASFMEQESLIEDFKTQNSVVQNSLIYFSQIHNEFFSDEGNTDKREHSALLLGRLSS